MYMYILRYKNIYTIYVGGVRSKGSYQANIHDDASE